MRVETGHVLMATRFYGSKIGVNGKGYDQNLIERYSSEKETTVKRNDDLLHGYSETNESAMYPSGEGKDQ